MNDLFKALTLLSMLNGWYTKAKDDGEVNKDEALELLNLIFDNLDFDVKINLD